MYQSPNMDDPEAKKAISAGFPLAVHTADDTYLKILRAKLPECIDKFEPELIFYNAGTDCLIGDPMGGLSISRRGIIARDEIVFGHAIGREIPIVMVLSGGYQSNNARVIADSILHLSRKFGLFGKELKKPDLESDRFTHGERKKKEYSNIGDSSDEEKFAKKDDDSEEEDVKKN